MQPATSNYLRGAVFGFAAVSIWASWSVITRRAVTTSLNASDIAALRFGVAGLLLSPVLVRRGLARDRLGWLGLAAIIAGTGAPYALVAAAGLHFAPAYDGGALNPGCMPLFVALIAAIGLGKKLSTTQKSGLGLILACCSHRRRARRRLEHLAHLRRCALPVRGIPDGMLHRGHAARGTRSNSRDSPRLHRIAGDLSADLPCIVRHPPVADAARRPYRSGALPGRPRDHRFPPSVWPYGCHPRRVGWRGLWRFGSGAVSAVCNTTPRRVAKRNGLGRHHPDLRRCLSGKRRTVAEQPMSVQQICPTRLP